MFDHTGPQEQHQTFQHRLCTGSKSRSASGVCKQPQSSFYLKRTSEKTENKIFRDANVTCYVKEAEVLLKLSESGQRSREDLKLKLELTHNRNAPVLMSRCRMLQG